MKKTIVIIILAIFVASIAIVNFFGLEIKMFDGITYVSSIQCDTVLFHGDNGKEIHPTQYAGKNGNIPVFYFDFIPADADAPYTTDIDSLTANPNVVQIIYEVMPHLADDAEIVFEYDENAGVAVYHELSGAFIFLRPDIALTITLRATDGSNVSSQIRIKGRLPDQQ